MLHIADGARPMSTLRGITWNQPRGVEPLLACSALWRARAGVEIVWDRRPPEALDAEPLEPLARSHDLIVLRHTHIGAALDSACLLPLNRPDRVRELIRLAGQSVGESFTSYRMLGDQWALPIDASAQVQAWRPDRMAGPAPSWDAALALAREGRALLPLRPPHALLLFYTLTANLGQPCGATGETELNDPTFGADVLGRIAALAAALDPACLDMGPADACERLARPEARECCIPYLDGEIAYARAEAGRPALAFGDIPVAGRQGPVGATLGGAGIAVSAHSAQPEAASEFAFWLANGEVQRGPYAAAGGQPANAMAWRDPALNAAAGDFFTNTWTTLDGAWVRPRHAGYVAFEAAAAARIVDGLRRRDPPEAVMADLNRRYVASFG